MKIGIFTSNKILAAGFEMSLGERLDERSVISDRLKDFDETFDMILIDQLSMKNIADHQSMGSSNTLKIVFGDVGPELAYQLLMGGIRGIVPTGVHVKVLAKTMDDVAFGERVYEKKLMDEFLMLKKVNLTPRESQLTVLLMKGLKNKEMATRLGITEGTIKVYLSRLFDKTGVHDRWELALWCMKNFVPNPEQFDKDSYESPIFTTIMRPREMETLHKS